MSSMNNRKSATRLLLINWSRFQYENIRLDGSTLFTGVNGSGKSTVLDAMTYLLTGNTQFNTAARDKDRNVKSYVRGDTKSNGTSRFLREGDVVSYIAMEFFSPVDDASMVIGVEIESASNNDATSSWFILRDVKIEDIRFCDTKDGIRSIYPKNRLIVKGKKLNRTDFIGREKAKDQIIRALGMRCDAAMYKKKLLKMMAFNPENNINQFISECVLDANPIESLNQLREQKELFEKVKNMYDNLLESKGVLVEIEQLASDYEKKHYNYLVRDMILDLQRVKLCEDEIGKVDTRLIHHEQELKENNAKIVEIERERKLAEERYNAAINNTDFQNFTKSIENLNRQLEELDREIGAQEIDITKIRELQEIIKNDLKWLVGENEKLISTNDILGNFLSESISASKKSEAFINLINVQKEELEKYSKLKYKNEDECDNLKVQLNEQEQIIKKLDANILHLPQSIRKAKDIIQAELSAQGIETEVRTFAELVAKVEDESFRASIETFIGRKRYNFIIDAKYCKNAIEIVHNKKLYDVNVVVTDKLPEADIVTGSAAATLDIPNVFARRYANYLLNGIHLCDDIDELHEYPLGGLTRDGMLAKSYAISCINIKKTEMCLGSDAIKLQKQHAEAEKKRLRAQIENCELVEKDCSIKINSLNKLDTNINNYRFDVPSLLLKNKAKRFEIEADKKEYEQNPDFAKIIIEQEKSKQLKDEVEEKYAKLLQNIGGLKNSINQSNADKEKLKIELEKDIELYDAKKKANPEIVFDAENEYDKAFASRGTIRVVTENYVKNMASDVDKAAKTLEDKQLEYCKVAETDNSKRGVVYIPFYREELHNLSNVKLEDAKNKMHEQERNLQSAFMHDFIGEINEAIRMAKDEIGAINRELKQIRFRQDTYQFKMKEKPDRAIFFRISDKLTEYAGADFYLASGSDDEEMEHDIKQFMDTILDEEDELEYTDYRRYFTYDMEIARTIDDRLVTSDLSKKQGSASNGEKQTPYFIILAASLMQCYPKNQCCARLAFIDEAFAALSRERIEQMVKYFEEHNFQVIYAAPPEKIASIGQFITTTVSLYPKGNYSYAIEGQYAG